MKCRLSTRQQRKYSSMVRCGAQARMKVKKADVLVATPEVVERVCITPEQAAEARGWKRDKSGRWRASGKFVKKELLAEVGLSNGK